MGWTLRVLGHPVDVQGGAALPIVATALALPGPAHAAAWVPVAVAALAAGTLGQARLVRGAGGRAGTVVWAGGARLEVHGLDPAATAAAHLAGPATCLLLGLPLLALSVRGVGAGAAGELVTLAALALVGWAGVSLVPTSTSEGGAALSALVGPRRAGSVGVASSVTVLVALVAVGAPASIVALAGAATTWEVVGHQGRARPPVAPLRQVEERSRDRRRRADDGRTVRDLGEAVAALRMGLPADALARLDALRASGAAGDVQAFVAELEGWAHLLDGDLDAARDALVAVPARSAAHGALRAGCAVRGGDRGADDAVAAALARGDLRAESERLLVQVVGRHGRPASVAARLLADGELAAALSLGEGLRRLGRERSADEVDALILGRSRSR